MGDLKPLGSEKLEGLDKIKRIIEISRYNEYNPNSVNESGKCEYKIDLADGNQYQIVKERAGYIIKVALSESETDYIQPIQDRKYYTSYSQALKRLNIITRELNEMYENKRGLSLFGEQKKYVLKTPKPLPVPGEDVENVPTPPMDDAMGMSAPPAPMDVPMPPAPEGGEMPTDMGDMAMEPEGMEGGEDFGGEAEGAADSEPVSFKVIQKLIGKVSQKLRTLDNKDELTDEDAKYVINSILSAIDLAKLEPETVEEIMSKFEQSEEMGDEEGMEGEDGLEGEEGIEDEMMPETSEMTETWGDLASEMASHSLMGAVDKSTNIYKEEMGEEGSLRKIADEMFAESKVGNILSNYFVITESEKKFNKHVEKIRGEERKSKIFDMLSAAKKLSVTERQLYAAKDFLKENSDFILVGRTNKKNLVFENKNKQIKITPKGMIL